MLASTKSEWKERGVRTALLWAALAFLLRLACAVLAFDTVPPAADGAFYHVVAQRIAQGDGYTWLWPDGVVTYAAHYPVGYPTLMAGLYALWGPVPGAVMVMNAAWGAVLVFCVHRVAWRVAGTRGAFLAAALSCFSVTLIAYTAALMTEGVVAALLILCGWLALRGSERGGRALFAHGVLLTGLAVVATLLRPQNILFVPLFAWTLLGGVPLRQKFGGTALVLIGTLVGCAPWTARNCARMDRCVFVSANGGWNLLIGTFPEGNGAWVPIDAARIPAECREVFGEAEKDHCFKTAGRRRILEQPVEWLSLAPAKLRATFDHTASAAAYLGEAGASLSDGLREALRGAEIGSRRILMALAFVGLAVAGRRRLALRGALALAGLASLFSSWAYVGLLLTAPLALVGVRRSPVLTLYAGLFLGTAFVHAVFFGAGRYSLVLEPYWAVVASLSVGLLPRRGRKAEASALTEALNRGDTLRGAPDGVDRY